MSDSYRRLAEILREEIASCELPARLAGFALITDDDLSTLSPAWITQEALSGAQDADLLFSPTDWPEGSPEEAFARSDAELRRLACSGFSNHAEDAFAVLVRSLVEAKAAGVFEERTFLEVLSSDPGPVLTLLEDQSVVTLNGPSVTAARNEFLAKWG